VRAWGGLGARLARVWAPHTALWLPVADLPPDAVARYCRRLAEFRPDVVVSYAGTLELLARRLGRADAPRVRPRAVVSSAEPLGPRRRRLVEAAFGCPVFDRYGTREVGVVAAECPRHEGLHVNARHLWLEIVDDDGRPLPPGETGRVVITDMRNRQMPLLRYALDDRAAAIAAPCPCGRTLPRITPVAGRTTDVVLCPSGRVLTEVPFERALEAEGGVEQFRLVQPEPRRLRVELVAPGLPDDRLAALGATFDGWLASELAVEVVRRERLAPTAAGKLPVIDSPVARAAFGGRRGGRPAR
jgi:phenylacetate-CoA ligase